MICGVMQGLLIKKQRARGSRAQAEARRRLREHVRRCDFCMREYKKIAGKRRLKKAGFSVLK